MPRRLSLPCRLYHLCVILSPAIAGVISLCSSTQYMSSFVKPSLNEVLASDAKRLHSDHKVIVTVPAMQDDIRSYELLSYAYERSF